LRGIDPKLLAIFEAEAREHIQRLRELVDAGAAPATLDEALRRAHTLKGAARAVGIEFIERVSHRLEALFSRTREGALTLDSRALQAVRLGIDAVEDGLAAVLAGGAEPDAEGVLAGIERALDRKPAATPLEPASRAEAPPPAPVSPPQPASRPEAPPPAPVSPLQPASRAEAPPPAPVSPLQPASRPEAPPPAPVSPLQPASRAEAPPPAPVSSPQPASRAEAPAPAPNLVRVDARTVDELVRSSTQLLAAGSSRLQAARGLDELVRGIAAIEKEWARLRRELSSAARRQAAGPDPQLAERLDLLSGHMESLRKQARAFNRAQQRSSWELHQLSEQLYYEACAVRMTPAGAILDPFHKMVRDLAHAEGKEVEFTAAGFDVEADRLVLQAIKDPIMHLLRNAVAHGIETPAERTAAGKPRAGAVSLRIEAHGDRLYVAVEDDGRGIDFARIAQVAARRGLIPEGAPEWQSPRALARLLFEPGFSTSADVTALAGRGMGLSVVYEQLTRLQGEVSFPEKAGPGAVVLLSAPLSISTHHVVLVACGDQTCAIPARAIERLRRVRPEEIQMIEGNEAIRIDGRPVLLARLADLLEAPAPEAAAEPSDGKPPAAFVIVLEWAGELAGLVVDRFVDERRAVVKDLGLPAAQAGISSGGVPLDDGGVAVVLSPAGLLDRFRRNGKSPGLKAAEAPPRRPKILVVDDSVTTRSLEKSILEAHGYQVRLAVDGVEALSQIRAERPDLVITDMMMPRMDGFELLERIKGDRQLAPIPVIIVTSLERQEDQERGLSLGADAYVVKRKFDQRELLRVVRQIL
jgi:two-component system chemotaxis sensor kinase CheA